MTGQQVRRARGWTQLVLFVITITAALVVPDRALALGLAFIAGSQFAFALLAFLPFEAGW